MKFYWCPQTRASRIAWMLEETGLPYDRVRIDIRDPASKSDPAFRAASPLGKVPAIADGEVKLWDSAAICMWLADRVPDKNLAPPVGDPARAAWYQWLVYTPGNIEPAMMEKLAGIEAKPTQYGWGSFDAMIQVLETGVSKGPWLLGQQFTAADVLVGSATHFLRLFGIVTGNAVLNAYTDRCAARPAFQRAMAMETE